MHGKLIIILAYQGHMGSSQCQLQMHWSGSRHLSASPLAIFNVGHKHLLLKQPLLRRLSVEESPISSGVNFSSSNFLQNLEDLTVQTLPTASAHHPAMMHKLRSLPSLVPLHLDSAEDKVADARSSSTLPCFQELLDVASAQKTALEVALEAAVKARKNISQRNENVETATGVRAPDTNTEESKQLDLQAFVAEPSLRAKVLIHLI